MKNIATTCFDLGSPDWIDYFGIDIVKEMILQEQILYIHPQLIMNFYSIVNQTRKIIEVRYDKY